MPTRRMDEEQEPVLVDADTMVEIRQIAQVDGVGEADVVARAVFKLYWEEYRSSEHRAMWAQLRKLAERLAAYRYSSSWAATEAFGCAFCGATGVPEHDVGCPVQEAQQALLRLRRVGDAGPAGPPPAH